MVFFFFYLPHCQDLINIHEFPALEYLSSWEEEEGWQGEGKERVPGGLRRVSQWGERGSLWVFFSPQVCPSNHSWRNGESWPPGWSSSSVWFYSSLTAVENYRPLWGRQGVHTGFSTLAEALCGNLVPLGSLATNKQGSTQGGI